MVENDEQPTTELKKWLVDYGTLSNPTRMAIVLVLYKNKHTGGSSMKFAEIDKAINDPPMKELLDARSSLTYHLEHLRKAGFVTKDPQQDERGRVYPLYALSASCNDFVERIGLADMLCNAFDGLHPRRRTSSREDPRSRSAMGP